MEEPSKKRGNVKGRVYISVDYEQFAADYMQAYRDEITSHDLAKRLGVGYPTILSRMGRIRKMGIDLPNLPTKSSITKKRVANIQNLVSGKIATPEKFTMKQPPIF